MIDDSRRPQPFVLGFGQDDEDFVGIRLDGKARRGALPNRLRQTPTHGAGMTGKLQPVPVLEIGRELRRNEPGLGELMPGTLADEGEVARIARVEEDDGLGREAAILGGPEGQDVDAGAPRDICRAYSPGGNRDRETSAVHVDDRAAGVGHPGKLGDLVRGIGRAELGNLGEAQRRRATVVDVAVGKAGQRRRQGGRSDLACPAVQADQPGTIAEELGRARLVLDDMRLAVAEDDRSGPGIGG